MNIEQQHFTIKQLAELWGMSRETIRRMFLLEPGVVKLRAKAPAKGHQRNYTSWRIPREVAERVYRRSTVAGRPE
jgi:hypothetical protein